MDENKICFITCVNDEAVYEESLLYVKRLVVPENMQVEFLPVRNALSMAAGYNLAMQKSDAKYKIYLHQDVLLLKKDLLKNILDLFKMQRTAGMLGVIGCKELPASGVWWGAGRLYGRVLHAPEPESISPAICMDIEGDFCRAAAVDGLLLATQYDVLWREDLFDGWHFYDTSQCFEFRRQGYEVIIPRQREDWCMHLVKQKPLGLIYAKYCDVFLGEYRADLEAALLAGNK